MLIKDLSGKSGVPAQTISDIELGAEPRVYTALKLAKALKTNVAKLWPVDVK